MGSMLWTGPRRIESLSLVQCPWRAALAATDCHPLSRMRPHKLALSLTQNKILVLLEEAGEEDMRTVRASVNASCQDLAAEIEALESLGFVQSILSGEQSTLAITQKGRATLTS